MYNQEMNDIIDTCVFLGGILGGFGTKYALGLFMAYIGRGADVGLEPFLTIIVIIGVVIGAVNGYIIGRWIWSKRPY